MARAPSLRSVAVFVAAGRALSFTAAARTLGLTPSAVSRRIADLEHELGVALFRRFNRRIELTADGESPSVRAAAVKLSARPAATKTETDRSEGTRATPTFSVRRNVSRNSA